MDLGVIVVQRREISMKQSAPRPPSCRSHKVSSSGRLRDEGELLLGTWMRSQDPLMSVLSANVPLENVNRRAAHRHHWLFIHLHLRRRTHAEMWKEASTSSSSLTIVMYLYSGVLHGTTGSTGGSQSSKITWTSSSKYTRQNSINEIPVNSTGRLLLSSDSTLMIMNDNGK